MSKKYLLTPVKDEHGEEQDVVVVMDDDWYELVTSRPWRTHHQRRMNGRMVGSLGASRTVRINGVPCTIRLHRLIAGVPEDFTVGYRDGDSLNLQGDNLVRMSPADKELDWRSSAGKSPFLGVIWDHDKGLWRSEIRGLVIGYHWSEIEAARQYNMKIVDLFGDMAEINDLRFLNT